MKNKIITILSILFFSLSIIEVKNILPVIAEDEEEDINEEENEIQEATETESHLQDRKKKKTPKSIHLPTAVIGGGNGKQDLTDIILLLDREKE